MNVRYAVDLQGITIFTDAAINHPNEDQTAQAFASSLEKVVGTDHITLFRYKVEVEVGLLFDTSLVLSMIRDVFEEFFNIESWDVFGPTELGVKSDSILKAVDDTDLSNLLRLTGEIAEA